MDQNVLIGILILVIFGIGAATMITRKLPALLTLPLMGVGIAGGAALIQALFFPTTPGRITSMDLFQGVLADGATMLYLAMIVAFFGGVISFLMQKSGTAESLVKQGAELIGDNPLGVAIFSMVLIALLFTSIGGLGAIIMVSMVVLPMLATVGVQPVVAGGIMLIGISLGGIMNAGNWVIYTQQPLSVPLENVKSFAVILFVLTGMAGITFICVELWRGGTLRSLKPIVITMVVSILASVGLIFVLNKIQSTPRVPDTGVPLVAVAAAKVQTDGVAITNTVDQTVIHLAKGYDREAPFMAVAAGDDLMLADYTSLGFSYTTTLPGLLTITLLDGPKFFQTQQLVQDNNGNKPHRAKIVLAEAMAAGLERVDTIQLGFTPKSRMLSEEALDSPVTLYLKGMSFARKTMPSMVFQIVQITTGVILVAILLMILVDIKSRIRRWRHQVVTIKWYAYLIPIVPLLLILVYNVPPLTAFLFGFVYAVLVTLRPGSISLTIQSMISGASTVIPAVMLMVGIGILIRAVLGPSGWSEANGGAQWPVLASIEPIFRTIIPKGPLGYVLVFGFAAPLALYRGPLNVWGLGYGVAALLMASGNLSGAAVMAMLLTVGQVQGICDPTNTSNVWLANELRVDVQALMWRTLPYIWGMVFVGLTIAAAWHMTGK